MGVFGLTSMAKMRRYELQPQPCLRLLFAIIIALLMETAACDSSSTSPYTLDSIRDSLVRQEDTIIFRLIERAKFPLNSATYNESYLPKWCPTCAYKTIAQLITWGTEFLQAKVIGLSLSLLYISPCLFNSLAGRYVNPEEIPLSPYALPLPLVHPNFSNILYPPAARVNMNKNISEFYFKQLLPLFVAEGDDGNYAQTAAADVLCLQALATRINDGRIVAELKYIASPKDYGPAILAKDINTLMKLLTVPSVEEMVKKRVEKKTKVFAQDVTLDDNKNTTSKYKVDPTIVRQLYEAYVIPMTKVVEVEYLLRRLNK
ncbi:chorismate mutase 2-like isoform X1 [Malania oleifera]|uniref:chorismate mutase 2-like isoform X1 n=1 Tax=Malania oleifera TaxID=397392 RepID=UPI0025AE23F1|nr:chorismate mutase 2-like isoform X1 [Malania oleifera]